MKFKPLVALIFLIILGACQKSDSPATIIEEPLLDIPLGFPFPDFPEANEFTDARWELGKKLFFDKRLARDNSISCASCHDPAHSFSDTVDFSPGVNLVPGTRNAPSLANVAYHPYFTRDGGVPSLEMQVLVPIQEHNEFDFNILEIEERLKEIPEYQQMAQEAYGRDIDYYVIPRALATFERSLLSGNSRFDLYTNQGNTSALTQQELDGMALFMNKKTNCASCHSGFNFTNYAFENNGLYAEYADPGRYRLTNNENDRALFKVPSLRNIEVTGPYMHDGSFVSLEEVVDHYNTGGKDHPHKSELIKPLNLSETEKASLVAFLKTLTDEKFITNEKFRPTN